MATSGTQTVSTAGVSVPGGQTTPRNREGDFCFPRTPPPPKAAVGPQGPILSPVLLDPG